MRSLVFGWLAYNAASNANRSAAVPVDQKEKMAICTECQADNSYPTSQKRGVAGSNLFTQEHRCLDCGGFFVHAGNAANANPLPKRPRVILKKTPFSTPENHFVSL